MNMLNIQTYFGQPFHSGWPLHPRGEQGNRVESLWPSPLISAILISEARLAVGFCASVLLGGVLGWLTWRWGALDRLIGPLFLGLQSLPSVCWVPLAILLFGINESAILFVLVMGSGFAFAIALRDGLRTIPPLYQRAGQMLGAHGWRLYRHVLFPASLPALAGSLRQGFAFAWRSLLGAELILAVQRHGLGFLLQTGRDFSDVAQVVAVMAVMIFLGMLMDTLVFAALERRVRVGFGLR